MRSNHNPKEVRTIVSTAFEGFGCEFSKGEELEETIRVDGGQCVAHCYRAGGLMAMWLIAAGLIQFYDSEGGMLLTVHLRQERQPTCQAA